MRTSQGKRMNFTTHAVTQRGIDQAMLLHHAAVGKLRADDHRLEMITLPLDDHLGIRQSGFDQGL
jgi:hypothetical protein